MSYRVLVIPEDFRNDRYVLEPIIAKMIESTGRRGKVLVCCDPLLGGVDQALRWERIEEIIDRYRAMIECFLLIVDRDGKPGRRAALDNLEQKAAAALGPTKRFLAENAWQEVEVWLLGGHNLPSGWVWNDVRMHDNPKEAYYRPFAQLRGVLDEPAEGRVVLGREAAARYGRISQLCPEVADLERRMA